MHPDLTKLFTGKGREISAHRFAIYIPSRLKNGASIVQARYDLLCDMAREFFYDELGGVTSYPAQGTWKEGKKIHHEQILVLESFCPEKVLLEKGKRIRDFVNALGIEFEQATMACVIDSEMVFLDPGDRYREKYAEICRQKTHKAGTPGEFLAKYVLTPLKKGGFESITARTKPIKKRSSTSVRRDRGGVSPSIGVSFELARRIFDLHPFPDSTVHGAAVFHRSEKSAVVRCNRRALQTFTLRHASRQPLSQVRKQVV